MPKKYPPGRGSQMQMKGTTIAPANPTGRLVVTSLPGAHRNGGPSTVHWAPKEGTVWTCPDCGVELVRDEDKRGVPWRVTPDVAV